MLSFLVVVVAFVFPTFFHLNNLAKVDLHTSVILNRVYIATP